MSASIEISGIEEIQRMFSAFTGPEMKTAMRNTLNDTAFDARKALSASIKRIFPTAIPQVVKSPYVVKATKENLAAKVVIGRESISMAELSAGYRGVDADVLRNALEPHIPGFSQNRHQKGMERKLIAAGLMREGQYLVPSRTMKLNKYGNVPGSVATKMLSDIGAYHGMAGAPGTTRGPKVKYIWGTVQARNGGTITGIWLQSGFRVAKTGTALQMLVVNKAPVYRKVFDFHRIGLEAGRTVMLQHASKAVDFVLMRRRTTA
jgi:hypothetical protein